jgi:hypothetical protein
LGLQVRLAVSPTFMEATPTCSLSKDWGFKFEKTGSHRGSHESKKNLS